ncbi:hypothetical protein N431DRAFT_438260 [Stipitochalara longipes BDJ]|nr:hypothetical protein N431DRAFT_438260 [Stipitochalara longipes BDJ]
MNLPGEGVPRTDYQRTQSSGRASCPSLSLGEPSIQQNFSLQGAPAVGQFISWRVSAGSAEHEHPPDEDLGDQLDPGLRFKNYTGPKVIKSRGHRRKRSHAIQRHVHKRNEIVVEERGKQHQQWQLLAEPDIDRLLGGGDLDPFNSLPVRISSSDNRLLQYFVKNIAPLHFPGARVAERDPMTISWIPAAMTDEALLHSTLASSGGHMLFYTNLPSIPSSSLANYLYHKTETIRVINERLRNTTEVLTDESLGAIALLITSQTCQGDYNEMNIHMRGLSQLVNMRGGLGHLGMNGLLAGEILWCDNVTAFLSASKPLLTVPENNPFEAFNDRRLSLFLTDSHKNENSPLWNPAFERVLSNDLIDALRSLLAMTELLNSSPKLSVHDMLVYDRKRAFIQHQLSNIAMPPLSADLFRIPESCRLASVIYSNLALWGFTPPMKLFGDLAEMLHNALQATTERQVDDWGIWWELLLWTLFIGGHAMLGRPDRIWFSTMIREILRRRNLIGWSSIRQVLELMPVYHTLWEPFQILWLEALGLQSGAWNQPDQGLRG